MIIRARARRDLAAQDRARAVMYEAARLMAFAVHKPGDMPEFKAMTQGAPREKTAAAKAADVERVRAWFVRQARGEKGE